MGSTDIWAVKDIWSMTRDFKENKNKDEKLLSNLNILKFSLKKETTQEVKIDLINDFYSYSKL